VRFGRSTIEHWLYAARNATSNPDSDAAHSVASVSETRSGSRPDERQRQRHASQRARKVERGVAPSGGATDVAGNPGLMTTELKVTVAEHAAGNYRVMMNIADELLVAAAERNLPQLDEKLYFDVFQMPAAAAKRAVGKKR
jgi:hypothetical protein